ncbi:MAG: YfhO family protein, partial [Candidatus Margulisiibacteriota bacterium]
LLRHKEMGGISTFLYKNPQVLPRAYVRDSQEGRDIQPGSRCEILEDQANEVMIKTFLSKPGYLFMSDTYYPGWRVFVDGKESRILKADNLFRAVKLREGKHSVRFVYEPFSFKLGAVISFVTFLLIGAIAVSGRVFPRAFWQWIDKTSAK